jgi:four helix bundle protein
MEKPHKKLDVWKAGMELALGIYKVTNKFPAEEKYGLTTQMRRAAVGIPSNIAEGSARQGKKEFKNFLSIAQGSLSELDTQMELALLLEYVDPEKFQILDNLMVRIDKMLTGLIRSLTKNTESRKARDRESGKA